MMNCLNLYLEETTSTNDYLARICNEQPVSEFTVVQADFQQAGKGQRGNSWESERGKNLLFSFVLYPTFLEARRQFILSQAISLAVKETLDAFAEGFSIKWPNDIYWQEKKIGGILIENELQGMNISRCIMGIGLNINQDVFVSSAPNPVSLKQITGKEHEREAILDSIMERMRNYYHSVIQSEAKNLNTSASCTQILRRSAPLNDKFEDIIPYRYKQSLFRKEGMHPYRDAEGGFMARILNVEADGHLVLEDADGRIRKYVFKEVQYVL